MSRSKPENVDRRRTWLLASAVMLLAIHGPATQSHARAEAFHRTPAPRPFKASRVFRR